MFKTLKTTWYACFQYCTAIIQHYCSSTKDQVVINQLAINQLVIFSFVKWNKANCFTILHFISHYLFGICQYLPYLFKKKGCKSIVWDAGSPNVADSLQQVHGGFRYLMGEM